ncbi:hypothetical protein E2C01_058313 [Portunus trituberculatus]|uniref:Uncharacterized protein n=1 Tax=Portunus trituberculatus TaxID=210409 RepID=A0A5B7GZI6_PORTR|nr:hypothetical protein [Portunus trituberculatus]
MRGTHAHPLPSAATIATTITTMTRTSNDIIRAVPTQHTAALPPPETPRLSWVAWLGGFNASIVYSHTNPCNATTIYASHVPSSSFLSASPPSTTITTTTTTVARSYKLLAFITQQHHFSPYHIHYASSSTLTDHRLSTPFPSLPFPACSYIHPEASLLH